MKVNRIHSSAKCWLALTLFFIGLSGCASNSPTPMNFASRPIRGEAGAILDLAEARLAERGYRVEQRDDKSGMLTATSDEQSGASAGVGISSRTRVRRIAEVRVHEIGGTPSVHCKVTIQEHATQGHRLSAQDSRSSDRPGDVTAIDRDAATTSQQNTVWRAIRRDKTAEREILEAISPSQER